MYIFLLGETCLILSFHSDTKHGKEPVKKAGRKMGKLLLDEFLVKSYNSMGLTRVKTKITSLEGKKDVYESSFLVDTGAIDSMAPEDELDKIGVNRLGKMAYELADNTLKEYYYGLVRIEFMGELTAGRIIFGEKQVEPLLGVTALESVGIMVDPANKILKRLPAISLK